MKTDNSQTVVIVLHPTEHLSHCGTHLVGPQAMSQRQLLALGFKVMELDCEMLSRLKVRPKRLRQMLAEKYEQVMRQQKTDK